MFGESVVDDSSDIGTDAAVTLSGHIRVEDAVTVIGGRIPRNDVTSTPFRRTASRR